MKSGKEDKIRDENRRDKRKYEFVRGQNENRGEYKSTHICKGEQIHIYIPGKERWTCMFVL